MDDYSYYRKYLVMCRAISGQKYVSHTAATKSGFPWAGIRRPAHAHDTSAAASNDDTRMTRITPW